MLKLGLLAVVVDVVGGLVVVVVVEVGVVGLMVVGVMILGPVSIGQQIFGTSLAKPQVETSRNFLFSLVIGFCQKSPTN